MAEVPVLANNDHLVQSEDPEHPANLIPSLCAKFYNLGWVTGTGGGVRKFIFPLNNLDQIGYRLPNVLFKQARRHC